MVLSVGVLSGLMKITPCVPVASVSMGGASARRKSFPITPSVLRMLTARLGHVCTMHLPTALCVAPMDKLLKVNHFVADCPMVLNVGGLTMQLKTTPCVPVASVSMACVSVKRTSSLISHAVGKVQTVRQGHVCTMHLPTPLCVVLVDKLQAATRFVVACQMDSRVGELSCQIMTIQCVQVVRVSTAYVSNALQK